MSGRWARSLQDQCRFPIPPSGIRENLFDSQAEDKQLSSSHLHFVSGRWESNPDHMLPKQVYYHYTTPRTEIS